MTLLRCRSCDEPLPVPAYVEGLPYCAICVGREIGVRERDARRGVSREIIRAIENAGCAPDDANLHQLLNAIRARFADRHSGTLPDGVAA